MKRNSSFIFALGAGIILTVSSCRDESASNEEVRMDMSEAAATPSVEEINTGEKYNEISENTFVKASEKPISTFSIDADGGSYSNVRRMIMAGEKPNKDAVRIEEFINYFSYNYSGNSADNITVNGEISDCPWTSGHKLVRIGIKGQETKFPKSNLVLLLDVSGSMSDENKLPLLKQCFKKLVNRLGEDDKISIVTYAGENRVVLTPTSCSNKNKIFAALDDLASSGSTNGSDAINKAYELAEENFLKGANNRILLATDGDFNVGITSQEALIELIDVKRKSGIFLTTIGVGQGNYNDANMEALADHGNGTYEYIDNAEEGERIFVSNFNRLFTIAKDVKVQIQFDTEMVKSYRLIGYENRMMQNEDFANDAKDAGDLGMGQSVTALYEIIPAENTLGKSYFKIDFRYKKPNEEESKKIEMDVVNTGKSFEKSSEFMRFTASVTGFGMLLRNSEYKGNVTYDKVIEWASDASSDDNTKKEFVELVKKAERL